MKLTHDELLILLIEECAEVAKAATKCLRFGYDVDHGTGYGNNAQALAKEMGELTAVRDALNLEDTKPMRDAFMDGWAYKIERAETNKEKYGRAPLSIG
jgi:NTP pyrophosphatase (non-canonical NTP hydrolase)